MAFSFGQKGATPNTGGNNNFLDYYSSRGTANNFLGQTPQAKALSSAQSPNMSTTSGPRYAPPPAIPTPSTPVKTMTVNNVDGSSHTAEFHKPETPGILPSSSNVNNVQNNPASYTAYAPGYGPQNTPDQGGTTPTGVQVNPDGSVNQSTVPQQTPQAPTFPGLINNATAIAQGNLPIGQSAADIAKEYGQKIADTGAQGAKAQAGYLTTGTSPVAEGNAAVQAQSTAAQQQALASGESAALQGTGQQLTAQQQAANALNTTGGLIKPATTDFGQAVFNPATGQFETGGGQYGTGPAAGANVQSVKDLTAQVNNWSSARNSANQIVTNQLNPFLQQNNVNPSDFNAVNHFLQTVGAQTSSTQYKQLKNLMTDIAQTYSQVLAAPGQDPSVWTSQTAQGLLDATAQGQSIQQVIASLDAQAQSKIQGVQNTINNIQGGGNVNPPANPGNTNSNANTTPITWDSIVK